MRRLVEGKPVGGIVHRYDEGARTVNIAIAGSIHPKALERYFDDDVLSALPRPADSTPGTQLVEELLRRGHDVGVAMLSADLDDVRVAAGSHLVLHVSPERQGGRGRDAFRQERTSLQTAFEVLRPDVIHAQWTYEYALAALASGRPTLVTMRDWAPRVLRLFPDPHRLVRFGMNAVVVARAPHLTVTSPFMESRLRRIRRKGTYMVPNGLRDDEIATAPRTAMGSPPRVMSVCNGFSRMKNTSTLLQAMATVRQSRPGAVLEMLGIDHGPGEAAHAWASAHGLDQNVIFTGRLPRQEVSKRLGTADVLGHPAREEPFGMAIVEAMALGVPVVVGKDSGAPPWLVDEGQAGVLVDVEDAESVADGILSLLQDGSYWQRLSHAAWERAGDVFRLRGSVDRYLELYARVIEDHAG